MRVSVTVARSSLFGDTATSPAVPATSVVSSASDSIRRNSPSPNPPSMRAPANEIVISLAL